MQITTLDEIFKNVNEIQRKRLAVIAANDKYVLHAVDKAKKLGLITPIFIGNKTAIKQIAQEEGIDISRTEIIDTKNDLNPAAVGINEIKKGNANMIMKGFISTKDLLQEIVKKGSGILGDNILSHLAVFQSPFYNKLLGITDAAMNIVPTAKDKIAILKNAVQAFHKLGVAKPKVALLAAIEKVNPKMTATTDADEIVKLHKSSPIENCFIQGPLALDLAVSKDSASHKGITGDVAGNADILVVPQIESGNILYKSLTCLGGAKTAGVILGASAPIILTSRADTEESKLLSIALAILTC